MAESDDTGTGTRVRSRDAWRDVGEQLDGLGKSLARALKATWESGSTRRPLLTALRQMDSDLHTLIAHLEREEQRAAAPVRIPVEGPPAPDLPTGTLEVLEPTTDAEPHADLAISDPEEWQVENRE